MFQMSGSAANMVISNIDNVKADAVPKKHPFEHDAVTVAVDRIAFVRVYTDIVEAPEATGFEETEKTDGTSTGTDTDANANQDDYDIDELHREYPIGSVVVTARVVAHVTYTSSKSTDSLYHIVVMLRGCVCGTDNTELDWKFVEIN